MAGEKAKTSSKGEKNAKGRGAGVSRKSTPGKSRSKFLGALEKSVRVWTKHSAKFQRWGLGDSLEATVAGIKAAHAKVAELPADFVPPRKGGGGFKAAAYEVGNVVQIKQGHRERLAELVGDASAKFKVMAASPSESKFVKVQSPNGNAVVEKRYLDAA